MQNNKTTVTGNTGATITLIPANFTCDIMSADEIKNLAVPLPQAGSDSSNNNSSADSNNNAAADQSSGEPS